MVHPRTHLPVWIIGLCLLLLHAAGCAHTDSVPQPGNSQIESAIVEEPAPTQDAVVPAGTGASPTDKGPRLKAKKKPAPLPDFTQPPPPAKPPAIGGTEG